MEGFLNLLKPPGMTSHDVVAFLRGKLREKRIGHCGTLDPNAAGVLPICLGQATRLASYVSEDRKRYFCEMTLGYETDTQDIWGNATKIYPDKGSWAIERKERLDHIARSFLGETEQETPAFSSVKIEGKPLYSYARQGKRIEGLSRKISIYALDIIRHDINRVSFVVECGSGTYVRMLCRDIGRKLDTGGVMSFLTRLSVGPFDIRDSLTLEDIAGPASAGQERVENAIARKETALRTMRAFYADESEARSLRQGRSVWLRSRTERAEKQASADSPDKLGWVKDTRGALVAIGAYDASDDSASVLFKPNKTFE